VGSDKGLPGGEARADETVNVPYTVEDVDAAVDFYTKHFGFMLRSSAAPAFADVVRGHLRLLLRGGRGLAKGALAVGSALAPLLVAVLGVEGAVIAAGLLLPAVVALIGARIRTVDRAAEVPERELELDASSPLC
jgi:catechol 2,3-dioxygenase-like lactoylglutathione lyase family enzyme